MIGDTTIYHLINDSLMAELQSFQDEKKFRHIWRLWRSTHQNKVRPFIHPKSAFDAIGFSFTPELLNDWDHLKYYSSKFKVNVPDSILLGLFPQQHKRRFFVFFLWENLQLQFVMLKYAVHKEASQIQRQFIVMNYITSLEQLIEDNQAFFKKAIEIEIRQDYQLIMSYFRLLIFRYFEEYIHIKSLRFSEEELLFYFGEEEREGISTLAKYFKELLKEKPPLSNEEFMKMAPLDILQDIQTEMGSLKQEVQNLRVRESLEMTQDEYLRPKDAAKILGISGGTLSNWRKSKKLINVKKVGNRYEYSLSEIRQLLKRN